MNPTLLLALVACTPHETGVPKSGDTDTGAAVDSHPADSDSTDADSDTDTSSRPSPCEGAMGWKYVECGYYQTCGIHTDGCAECWGRGEEEGGPARDTGAYHWYGEDLPPEGDYASIAMISTLTWRYDTPNACGILMDGSAVCWGQAVSGINEVPEGNFVDLAVWTFAAYGIVADGTAEEWPEEAAATAGSFVQVETGTYSSLFLATDGTLVQTSIGGDVVEEAPAGTFIDIGMGSWYGCAVRTDGSILCWDPDHPEHAEYEAATLEAPPGPFVDVCVLYGGQACALGTDGVVLCWNYAENAEPPKDEVFSQIACGGGHACGVTPDGRILCWGSDRYGETIVPT